MLEDIKDIELLSAMRSSDLSEPVDLYLKMADQLESGNRHNYITRANFIREQCKGLDGKTLFDKHREDWDIYNFSEDLITVEDFRRGFLWRFRDHTTSWSDSQKAKTWFLTSPEGLFVRRYEFWTCDNAFDECIDVKEGSYKEILVSLLNEGDYEVLASPAFSRAELKDFIREHKNDDLDFTMEEIIEDYIEANPNYLD